MTWWKLAVDISQVAVGVCAILSLYLSRSVAVKEFQKSRRKRYKKRCPKFLITSERAKFVDDEKKPNVILCFYLQAIPKKTSFEISSIELVRPLHGRLLKTPATELLQRILLEKDSYPEGPSETQGSNLDSTHFSRERSILPVDWVIPSRDSGHGRLFVTSFCVSVAKTSLQDRSCFVINFRDRHSEIVAQSKIIVVNDQIVRVTSTNIPESIECS